MTTRYKVQTTQKFERSLKKIIKKDKNLSRLIIETLKKLGKSPFSQGLNTHKVQSRKYGIVYSSKVTGDIRILWVLDKNETIIITLTVGGHSGNNSVY